MVAFQLKPNHIVIIQWIRLFDMASSLQWNAKSSCLQRFNDYLNGLRGEFELQPKATVLRSRRFYLLIGNLRGEFELMAEDVEALRKERNDFKAKGVYFVSLS